MRILGRPARSRIARAPEIGRGRDPASAEVGQITLLVIAYALIAFSLLIVVVDITAVHLQRQRLYSLTDAAALDAADALDGERFYHQGASAGSSAADVAVPLSDQSVEASVDQYLHVAGPLSEVGSVAVGQPTGSPDGVTAEVTLVGRATLPLFSFAAVRWSDGVPLRVTARARARASP